MYEVYQLLLLFNFGTILLSKLLQKTFCRTTIIAPVLIDIGLQICTKIQNTRYVQNTFLQKFNYCSLLGFSGFINFRTNFYMCLFN